MTLLQLPTELLLHILGFLGADFFIQDTRRLAVSKRWYDLAWTSFVRDLSFTARSLRGFVKDEHFLTRCQPYISTVQLYFAGYDDARPFSPTDPELEPITRWVGQFTLSLERLAAMLQQYPGVRSLKLKARCPPLPGRSGINIRYLMAKPLVDLLSVRHLTSLDLDTASTHPHYRQNVDDGLHLCCSINALLPSLRRLRCRMDKICENLLKPPPQDTPLKLEEIIINFSISGLYDSVTAYHFSRLCPSSSMTNSRLENTVEAQATALSHRLNNARMVRVISHVSPSLDLRVFDAITGERSRLRPGAAWDAPGEALDEPGQQERDLFDDDSPSTPETTW